MFAKRISLVLWLLVAGQASLRCLTSTAQCNKATERPASIEQFNENSSQYFPAGSLQKLDGVTNRDSLAWYLHTIGEPPLFKTPDNAELHAYRLIWIAFPAWKPVVLRLQVERDGTGELSAKQVQFGSTEFLLNERKRVSIAEVNSFLECVKRADFWKLPTGELEPGTTDGSYWFLEGKRGGDYRVVFRRTPEDHPGAFTDIGRYLAKNLARLEDSTINIPRGDRSEPLRRN